MEVGCVLGVEHLPLQHLLGLQLHLLHLLLSIAVFSIQRDISYQAFLARYILTGPVPPFAALRDADLALSQFLPTRCGSQNLHLIVDINSMLPSAW